MDTENKDHYQHRSTDEHGNPDDKFTEQEALEMAKAEGITFVDDWLLFDTEAFANIGDPYPTEEAAKAALAQLPNPEKYTISQRRRQA